MRHYWPLLCLALLHAIVDCFAMIPEPLLPWFKSEFRLSPEGLFVLLTVSQFAANFSQPVFGYVRDRYGLPAVLWLGPVVGILCISLIGISGNLPVLCLLSGLGMVGVGAFHPQAAVTAGTLLPEQRTRGLSLFMFGGTLGLGLGPTIGGFLVASYGLKSLAVLAIPGTLLVCLLYFFSLGNTAPRAATPPSDFGRQFAIITRQWKLVCLLLVVSSLRVVPNIGMTKALAFSLSDQGLETSRIGLFQSIFLVSGSIGMLLMATSFRSGWERASMIICPLAGIPLLFGLGTGDVATPQLVLLLILSGALLNGTTPAMVSYAHHAFPQGAGFASALTMGVSWGFGGILVALLISGFDALGHMEWLFPAFIPCQILAGIGALLLPDLSPKSALLDEPLAPANIAPSPAPQGTST